MILDLDRNTLDTQAADRPGTRLRDGKAPPDRDRRRGAYLFFFSDHASPRQGPTNVREGRSQRRCAEVPEHSVLVRRAPPQHDEQYHQSDNTGDHREQHRWRGGAHPLEGLLSAGPDTLRGLPGLLLGQR
jgi:hypothetical protein